MRTFGEEEEKTRRGDSVTNQYHLKVFQGSDFKQRHQRGRDQEKGTERRETLHLCFFLTEGNIGETANTQYVFVTIVRVRRKFFKTVFLFHFELR